MAPPLLLLFGGEDQMETPQTLTPAPFKLYNTLSKELEAFVPLKEGEVKLYVCGMTVYDHIHIGHGRAMVVFDAFGSLFVGLGRLEWPSLSF